MSEAVGRHGGKAADTLEGLEVEANGTARLPAYPPDRLTCNRCGFPVRSKPWGCKNPCANCGTVYPLGDCSD